ncbi:hypothetical protein, partial [Escherichia coli]|uniref:hypothetical protein n=1 Tax=Escherichia coli TaxID=562 RepID=UPI001411D39D
PGDTELVESGSNVGDTSKTQQNEPTELVDSGSEVGDTAEIQNEPTDMVQDMDISSDEEFGIPADVNLTVEKPEGGDKGIVIKETA